MQKWANFALDLLSDTTCSFIWKYQWIHFKKKLTFIPVRWMILILLYVHVSMCLNRATKQKLFAFRDSIPLTQTCMIKKCRQHYLQHYLILLLEDLNSLLISQSSVMTWRHSPSTHKKMQTTRHKENRWLLERIEHEYYNTPASYWCGWQHILNRVCCFPQHKLSLV